MAWQVVVDVNSWNTLQRRYFTLRTPCSLISHTSHSLLHSLLCHAPASILYITYTVFADQLYVTQSVAHCSVSIRHRYFALIYTVFADQPYVTQSVAHCSVSIQLSHRDYTYCLERLAERCPRPRTSVFICHFILDSITVYNAFSVVALLPRAWCCQPRLLRWCVSV